ASAWITIFTVTEGGVTVKPLVRTFLFASRITTGYGWLVPDVATFPRSTGTTAWIPGSWLLGPWPRPLAGVSVVAFGCSWRPAGSVGWSTARRNLLLWVRLDV